MVRVRVIAFARVLKEGLVRVLPRSVALATGGALVQLASDGGWRSEYESFAV
jgi:hypothetical protein